MVVITGTQGSNPLDRYAWPLIDRFASLHLETGTYLVDGIIEEFHRRYGSQRLVFSSGFPDCASGAALLTLARAEIPEPDRAAVAAGNLERLLAWSSVP